LIQLFWREQEEQVLVDINDETIRQRIEDYRHSPESLIIDVDEKALAEARFELQNYTGDDTVVTSPAHTICPLSSIAVSPAAVVLRHTKSTPRYSK
jgi:hypothetical protein